MPYRFQGQHKDEEVILIAHQHPAILLRPLLLASSILWVPFLGYVFFAVSQPLLIVALACLLMSLGEMYRIWHMWHNSLFLLTSERLVVVDQRHLFVREFRECTLASIQQVAHKIEGVGQTMWHYGNISVYTAGAHEPFAIPNIPQPYEVQQEIQRMAAGEGYIDEEDEDEKDESDR